MTEKSPTLSSIPPGATLGVLGGGQLGRMFAIAALQMGYKVVVLDPDPGSPAGALASEHLCASYDDPQALERMSQCDAVTIEFENIPVQSLQWLADKTRLAPGVSPVSIAQNRVGEKTFAQEHGVPTVEFAVIDAAEQIEAACNIVGFPAILKTTRLGYDGKGQLVCENVDAVKSGFETLGAVTCVLEERVELAAEVSVVLARTSSGDVSICPVAENIHETGILDVSIAPARVDKSVCEKALDMANTLVQAMDYCGVLAVEFFVCTDGRVLMNEMAPRPHNSGHFSLDATTVSQFQLQVLAMCDVPLPACDLLSPVVMLNILGDRWNTAVPKWERLYSENFTTHHVDNVVVQLHLYGKSEARPGRKMGHVNIMSASLDTALESASKIKDYL